MVLERAEVIIKPGLIGEFLDVLRTLALPLTTTFTGLISFTALRGVEDADNGREEDPCENTFFRGFFELIGRPCRSLRSLSIIIWILRKVSLRIVLGCD